MMGMNPSCTVRAWQPGDLPRLERLLAEVFWADVASRARWKYLENPALPEPLVAVAEAGDGRLVACYPFVGRRFVLPGGPRLAVLGADLAVLPEYRVGGELHGQLGLLAGELARRVGAVFAYGFPNRDAYRVAKRLLGVKDWSVLEAWLLPLGSPGSALLRRGWSRLGSPRRDGFAGAPAGIPAADGEGLRDARFLRWRFGDARRYRFRLGSVSSGAYLVVAAAGRLGRDLLVVDFGPSAAEAELEALLRAEIADGRPRGVERLWVWCLPRSAMARAVERLHFRRAHERDMPVTADRLLEEPPARPAHLTIADADDP